MGNDGGNILRQRDLVKKRINKKQTQFLYLRSKVKNLEKPLESHSNLILTSEGYILD